MAIRIQLASNFQVVELTYDNWNTVNEDEVEAATELVNKLGKDVVNDIKKPIESKPTEKMASEKQISFACKLGLSKEKAEKMTQKELWKWLQDNK